MNIVRREMVMIIKWNFFRGKIKYLEKTIPWMELTAN